jgi:hypothetical protein
MNWRERIADWITGGALTRLRARLEIDHYWVIRNGALVREEGDPGVDGIDCRDATIEMLDEILEERVAQRDALAAEAANIAAQRDEAIAQGVDYSWQVKARNDALRAILTARNITEARKIARDALGDE